MYETLTTLRSVNTLKSILRYDFYSTFYYAFYNLLETLLKVLPKIDFTL